MLGQHVYYSDISVGAAIITSQMKVLLVGSSVFSKLGLFLVKETIKFWEILFVVENFVWITLL